MTPHTTPPPPHGHAHHYRACDLCAFGKRQSHPDTSTGAATTLCMHPDVRGPHPGMPAPEARAPHGPCGPEAQHLSFPGLHHT